MRVFPPAYADWSVEDFVAPMISARSLGNGERALREATARIFGDRDVLPVNSGSTAIRLVLETLQQHAPHRDTVILPAFICPSVPRVVRALGLRIHWVDIDAELNIAADKVEEALSAHTLAVVVAHMYGAPAKVKKIGEICQAASIPIVDDAAQVVGEVSEGYVLGTFGVAGVVSFAQSKSVVCGLSGSGGLLIVNDAIYRQDLLSKVEGLPHRSAGKRDIIEFALKYLMEPMSGHIRRLFERGIGRGDNAMSRIGNAHAWLAARQIGQIDHRSAKRKEALARLCRRLRIAGLEMPQFAEGRYLARAMVGLPEGVAGNKARQMLHKSGILSRLPYPLDDELQQFACPHAMKIVPRLIEFPLSAVGTDEFLETAVVAFASALEGLRA